MIAPAETYLVVMTSLDHRTETADAASPPIDWSAALQRNERWLRTVVRARLGEAQAVDEVMQEVALAAVAQRAPIADPAKVAPWLYRLAVRQALLYRRKQGRRRKLRERYAAAAEAVRPVEETSDPLAWLLSEERRRHVRQAVARLAPRDAEILMLKYGEQWSYRQLAAHLGASESAVEARLHRARARLRAELSALDVVEA